MNRATVIKSLASTISLSVLGAISLGAMAMASLQGLTTPTMTAAFHLPRLPISASREEPPPKIEPVANRADRKLDRAGYTLVSAGALFVPSSFASADGTFDLLIHFHGNAQLVAESVAASGLSALVLVVNVGMGSAVYDERYAYGPMLDFDLERVTAAAAARGLERARVGRIALSAWSAGYAAIAKILEREDDTSRISAVLLCDALHADIVDMTARAVDMERLRPFVRFARRASSGEKLFVMTHSEIGVSGYATTTETSNAILHELSVYRARKAGTPPRPSFPLARAVMSSPSWLEQRSIANVSNFTILGYGGFREDDHIAHLSQMSSTVLPKLIAYWKDPGEARVR